MARLSLQPIYESASAYLNVSSVLESIERGRLVARDQIKWHT